MADDTAVIKEFLVSLGFAIKEGDWKKFTDAVNRANKPVADADKRFASLTKTIEGLKNFVGAAATLGGLDRFVVAVDKVATNLDNLYWQSIRTSTSAQNLKALGYSMGQTGSSAQAAAQAIEAFTYAQKANPGLTGLLAGFGIQTHTVSGALRDQSAVMLDFFAKLKSMPEYLAIRYAALFGIGDIKTIESLMRNQKRFGDQHKAFARSIGLDMETATRQANDFKTAEGELFGDLDLLVLKGGASLIAWLEDVGNANGGQLGQLASDMQALSAAFRSLGDAFGLEGKTISGAIAAGFRGALAFLDELLKQITHTALALSALRKGDWAGAAKEAGLAVSTSPLGTLAKYATGRLPGQTGFVGAQPLPTARPGPAGTVAGPSAPAAHGLTDPLGTVSQRGSAILRLLTGYGVSLERARGIVAGMFAENNTLDPNRRNSISAGKSHAYGLGQWLGAGQREFASVFGHDIHKSNLGEQIAFMMYQWQKGSERPAGGMILGAASAGDAMTAYLANYMRPGTGLGGDLDRGGRALTSQPILISQKTEIHIHGVSDAKAAGAYVADQQTAVNARLARNFKSAVQ